MSDRASARGDRPSPTRRPRHARRVHYPNLSPTRPPACPTDARLWPAWTDADIWSISEDYPLFERVQRGGGS